MGHNLVGWCACAISLIGNLLATAYQRKVVMWGWLLFFVGNLIWIFYAITLDTMPLVVYNSVRAVMSLRGARNNTLKHIRAVKAKTMKRVNEVEHEPLCSYWEIGSCNCGALHK